jgi:hypothetical protein
MRIAENCPPRTDISCERAVHPLSIPARYLTIVNSRRVPQSCRSAKNVRAQLKAKFLADLQRQT